MSKVYQAHASSLNRDYEDSDEQVAILHKLGQMAIEPGRFKEMVSGHMQSQVTYSVEQYLMLLNTYSPYLKLDPTQKQQLFAGLQQQLEQNGDRVQLSYVSAFHIVWPQTS